MVDFKDIGLAYAKEGLSLIPLLTKEKRPGFNQWQRYCGVIPSEDEITKWSEKYDNPNFGLCLGTNIGKHRLVAIDIDDDNLVSSILSCVPKSIPSKKGAKGLTLFGLVHPDFKNEKVRQPKSRKPGVEFLCHGSQTVVPPSTHPSGVEYKWTKDTLLQSIGKLPILTDSMLDEIRAYALGKGACFVELNEMVWKGVDKGGNTHDVCVAAAGLMVSRGWADGEIHDRIDRAKEEACSRAGEKYNWPGANKAIQGWIDSAREKGMTNSSNKRVVPAERKMADWIIFELGGEENVATIKGQLRHYKEGHWPLANKDWAMREMYKIDAALKERDAKAAMSITHTLTRRETFGETPGVLPKEDPMKHRICLENGALNIKTGELERHDGHHELLYKLGFRWEKKHRCEIYDDVVSATFNNDKKSISLWDEYCALTLIDDMSFQKMLFLKGPGGNGKGTLARILRSMHSPDAVGSVGITDLNDERKRTSLVGKLVNISGEQSRLNLVSDTYLKKITGEDPIDVRRLYGETQNNIRLSVRFLELVNEMPSTSDHSHALRRRIIILDCPNKVLNPDLSLDEKLYKERSGILVRWVAALNRLYKRGTFDEPESSRLLVEQYMMENDQVAYWIQECLDPITEEGEKGTPSRELYGHYNSWARAMGFKYLLTEIEWGRRLIALDFPSKNTRISKMVIKTRMLKTKKGMEF